MHRMLGVLFGCSLVVSVCSASRAGEAKPPEQLAHFDNMAKPGVFPDGTLALYGIDIRGPGLAPTPAVQQLRARYSKDNGRTWSEPESLVTLPAEEGGFGFHEVLVDREGEVHIFALCDANTGVIRERTGKDGKPAPAEPLLRQHLDIWQISTSEGRTKWGQPERIFEGRAGDLQSVIQLKSGRFVLPFCHPVNRSWRERGEGLAAYTFFGQIDCSAVYSDDDGKTWQRSKSELRVQVPYIGANGSVEPVVVQLNDGRVWMLIRTQTGRFWESFSADGSEWSPPRPTGILSADAPAGFVRLADQRLVMMWNNCQRYPYAQGGRRALHAAISADDGKTWRGRREVLLDPHRDEPPPPHGDHGVAYPYPVLAHDGRIVYTMWVETGQGRSVQAFDPEWLLETGDGDDFSKGLGRWSIFGTKGVSVVDQPESADGHALALQKVDAEFPAAAVWNFPCLASGSVKMRVMVEGPFAGATVLLSDHFSSPFDLEDVYYSVYRLQLAGEGGIALPAGRWSDLELRWDGAKRTCEVLVDGKSVATLPQLRESPGPSYLRLRCRAEGPENGRLLVDSVKASGKS